MTQIAGKQIKSATITETQLATSVAGAGLTGGGGTPLAVNTSGGVTISGDDVVINTTSTVTFTSAVWTFPTDAIQITGTPNSGNDGVNKTYADSLVNGLSWKNAAKAASTVNLAAETFGTGGVTYANGTAGVGATLTQVTAANGAFGPLDGVTIVASDRVLIMNQTTAFQNGLYSVTTLGNGTSIPWVLTRVTDCDEASELDSAAVFVQQGTTKADIAYTQTASSITVGTTSLVWTQFAAAATASAYTTITGDTGTATPATSSDTLTFIGGIGIVTVAAQGSPDSVTIDADLEAAGTGTGGITTSSSKLKVLANTAAGIKLLTGGVSADLEAAGTGTGGLTFSSGAIKVLANTAAGIKLLTGGVSVDLEAAGSGTGGLTFASGAIRVDVGDGNELNATGVAVKPADASITVSGSGVSAHEILVLKFVCSVTTTDGNSATSTTVSTDATTGDIVLTINGISVDLGETTTGVDAYISGDGGATARTFEAVTAGDTIRWVGSTAGYQLAASDVGQLIYNV